MHETMLEAFAQKEPRGHCAEAVEPAAQYAPAEHAVMLEAVEQKEPSGHCAEAVEPAGQ